MPPAARICIIIDVPERGSPETTVTNRVAAWFLRKTEKNPMFYILYFSGPFDNPGIRSTL